MIWEYHCITFSVEFPREIEEILNTKGQHRWELVDVVRTDNIHGGRLLFTFKRPLLG